MAAAFHKSPTSNMPESAHRRRGCAAGPLSHAACKSHLHSVGSMSAELRLLPGARDASDCCCERREDRARMPEPSDASDGLGGMAGSTTCGAESGGHRKQRYGLCADQSSAAVQGAAWQPLWQGCRKLVAIC